jgi:proteic killer suppression protein
VKVTFDKTYLKDLYENGKTEDKKHRFQPDIVKRYQQRIKTLTDAPRIETLYQIKALNYEVLSGEKEGISSIRVNDKYRIEFTVENVFENQIVTICNILELSNHYK